MQKQEKSRKPLIIGVIAAVVVLAVVLALLLTQCIGGGAGATTDPNATAGSSNEVPTYELYWNLDRAEYDGKSEAGMSSRMPEADGYFHVRFILDGEEVVLKVADRKLINAIDIKDLMGLEFDENGIVIGVLDIDDMPLEKIGWQFYVQSAAKTLIKLNSSESMNGMEVLLECDENTGVYDMSGMSGNVGCTTDPINMDRVYAVANLGGEITHVFIYQRPNYMLTHEGECEHCKKTVTWYEWTKTDSVPLTTGHYQLMNDIQLKGQPAQQEDAKVCLDLNGKRIDGASGSRCYAMFNAGTELAIMDTSEGQTGVMAAHGKGDQGMVVWVRYGALYLYGGTLDASDAVTKLSGTAIECGKGKYFYMYGGTIIGGKAEPQKNDKGAWTQGLGGTMSLGGKFVMHGGEIRDGYAEAKVTTNASGEPVYNRGFGGNIYASTSAVIELNGGVIKNGRAGNVGGNIYMDGAAELTINGGKIQGGTITGKGKNGGSIFAGSKTKIVLTSGSVSGGTCRNCGGNIYTNGVFTMTGGSVYGGTIRDFKTGKVVENSSSANIFVVNGKFNMYGGKIDGGVQATDTSATDNIDTRVYLTTHATIVGGKFNTRSLTLSSGGSGVTVSVGKMRDEALVGVYTTTGYFTLPTLEENKDNFFSEIEGADIIYHNERLALGKAHCICGKSDTETTSNTHINGCDGEVIVWAPWTSTSSIPTATGNYYLLKDVTTTSQQVVGRDKHVKLDLNGKNITFKVPEGSQDGFRLYRADYGGKLQITDTTDNPGTLKTVMPDIDAPYSGNTVKSTVKDDAGNVVERVYFTYEEIKAARKAGNFGMIFWARGGEIIFHNGKIDGSNLSGSKDGLLMTMGDEAYTDATTGEKTLYQGSITIYNGDIKLGSSSSYGNINVNTTGEMFIHGGTFTGTSDKSRGFYVRGVLTMTGGTITGCAVQDNGANVAVAPTGTMHMSGGTITGGHARKQDSGSAGQGGNVAIYGVMNMSGGKILDGVADSSGTNVQLIRAAESNPATLNMSGGTIAGGIELNNYKGNCKIVLSGKPVIDKSLTSEGVKAPSFSLSTGSVIGAVDASGMTGGKVGIRASTYFATGGNDTIKGYFFSEAEGAEVLLEKGGDRLFLGGEYCLCGASKHEGAQHLTKACDGELLQWMVWINTTSLPSTTGNYFLEKNVSVNAVKTITNDADIKIDLNGKVLKSTASRLYRLNPGNVTVTDSSKDLLGTIKVTGLRRDQGIFWVNDGDLVWVRGTMDGTEHTLAGEKSGQYIGDRTGGLIAIDSKASFTMYSGALLGGKTESVVADDGTTRRGYAPTLHSSGITNIYGGELVGGVADRNTGNINISAGIFTLHDGVIRDGKAQSDGVGNSGEGGNVYMSGGTFFMNGGTITGGEGVDFGGNVYVKGGTFALIDGTIADGKVNPNKTEIGDLGYGGNIYANGTFKMTGGTITGGVAYVGTSLKDEDGNVIYKPDGKPQVSGGGGLGGNICIAGTAELTGGTITGGVASTGGNFGTNSEGAKITLNGVRIEGGQADNGGNVAVNVRACTKFEVTGSTVITGGNATGNGGNIFIEARLDTKVNNMDMIADITGGTIEKGTAGSYGGNIYANNSTPNDGKNILNISGGAITEGKASRGGNIYLTGVTCMEMTGGTVSDGIGGQGGNIFLNGGSASANISGETALVTGGTANDASWAPGGNIRMTGDAKLTIDGGATVESGKGSDGHNLYLSGANGKITLGECTIRNTSDNSSNILIEQGTLEINGATIVNDGGKSALNVSANSSPSDASKPTYVANIVMNSGTITGGTRGNVSLPKGDKFTMNGGLIEKGTATTNGGNISIANSEFTLNGGSIEYGAAPSVTKDNGTGGNIIASGASKLFLNGGEIKDGTASNGGGGNIMISGTSEVTVDGATISGGYATGNGGSIQVSALATFRLKSGILDGGHSKDSGGNIAAYGKVIISGGQVLNGVSDKPGNGMNISILNTNNDATKEYHTLELTGGTIAGGLHFNNFAGNVIASLSGKVIINKELTTIADKPTYSMKLAANDLSVGQLTEGSEIWVSGQEGIFSFKAPEHSAQYFHSEVEDLSVFQTPADDYLLVYGKVKCLCGSKTDTHIGECNGETLNWMPWDATNTLPSTSGSYYLLYNVTDSGHTINNGTNKVDFELFLDLNGKTVTSKGSRMYSLFDTVGDVKGSVTICDNSTNRDGVIKVERTSGDQGQVVWMRNVNQSIAMYGGTIDATSTRIVNTKALCGVAFCGSGSIKLFRGTINGGTTDQNNWGGSAVAFENSNAKAEYVLGEDMVINAVAGSPVYISDDAKINVSKLKKAPASAWAVDASGIFTTGWNKDWNISDYFVSASESGAQIFLDEESGELFMGKQYCICGKTDHIGECNGQLRMWRPLRVMTGLKNGGNWYLVRNITCGTQTVFSKDTAIDLNGKNFTFNVPVGTDGYRMLRSDAGAKVEITDCSGSVATMKLEMPDLSVVDSLTDKTEDEKQNIKNKMTEGNQGMLIWIREANGSFHIYNGILDGTEIAATKKDGATVRIDNNGVLNVYGGTLKMGSIGYSSNTYIGSSATMNMYGGTIVGGKANNGGAIGVYGTLKMYGGQIENGTATASGGNINVNSGGEVFLYDGTVTGGTATSNGGNIAVQEGGELTVSKGLITLGTAQYGGNVYIKNTTATINGGTISGGHGYTGVATKYPKGGNIYATGGELIVNGNVTVSGGKLTESDWMPGGNICAEGGAQLTFDGGAVVEAGDGQDGNNLYLTSNDTTATLKNCTFNNTVNGTGNIMVERGTLIIEGATIANTADGYNLRANETTKIANYIFNSGLITGGHPNVTLGGDDTFTMNGGTIENGSSSNGGNFNVTSTTITIKGGTITGGNATGSGGNIALGGASELIIEGGEIKDGTATSNGGNIVVWDSSTVTIKNATISNGTSKAGGNILMDGSANLIMDSGELKDGDATAGSAGNLCLWGSSTATINGGTITGGTATGNGGNINVSGKNTLTINNGTITNGYSKDSGGNIAVYGKMVMSGGQILNGVSGNAGNGMNISVISTSENTSEQFHTIELTGGTIAGGVHFNNAAGLVNASLSGNIVINKALTTIDNKPTYSMRLAANDLTIGQLTSGAEIWVSGQEGVFSYKAPEGSAQYFHSETEGLNVFQTPADELVLVYGKTSCVCGVNSTNAADHIGDCDGTQHNWTPVTALPETSGYYYLVSNVTESGSQRILKPDTVQNIYLDLNGKTVTSGRSRMYRFDSTVNLTITDNSKDRNGTIKVTNGNRDQGAVVWFYSGNSTFTMYAGIIDSTGNKNNETLSAAGHALSGGAGTYKLYGGTIMGGTIQGNINKGGTAVSFEGSKTHVLGDMEISSVSGTAIFVGDYAKIDLSHITEKPATPWLISASGVFTENWNEEWNIADFFVLDPTMTGCEIVRNADGELEVGKYSCLCGQSTHIGECNGDQLFWEPWRTPNSLPKESGNWYLYRDLTGLGQTNIDNATAQTVNLDLAGHKVTANATSRIYVLQNSNVLNVVDSVGTGMLIGGGSTATNGGVLLVNDTSKLSVYGGTITLTDDAAICKDGSIIQVNSVFNMYGGQILVNKNAGNAIHVSSGNTMNMTGGSILNTSTRADGAIGTTIYLGEGSELQLSGGTIESTGDMTRNINAVGNLIMTGGEIKGGNLTGDNNGASIIIDKKSTSKISGGSVIGGNSANQGGNIVVYGELEISGSAVIKDGRSGKDQGHNIAVVSPGKDVYAKLTIAGGSIAGGVYFNTFYDVPVVKISGAPTVDKSLTSADALAKPSDSIRLSSLFMLDVTGMTGGEVYVKGTGAGQFAINATEGMEKFFESETVLDGVQLPVCYDNGGLCFGKSYCLCGASETGGTHSQGCLAVNNGEELIWLPADSLSDLSKSGNYYLTTDLTNKGHTLPGNANINLDLNGHTIERDDGTRLFSFYNASVTVENTTLTITNTVSGKGGITTSGQSTNQGSLVWLTGTNNTLNLIQGMYNASGFTLSAGSGNRTGAAIDAASTSAINIYEGVTLMGGEVVQGGSTNTAGGGAIATTGKLNIYGGTITGGRAVNGGNLYISGGSAVIKISGGTITSGTGGQGGNIYMTGACNVTITGSETKIMNGTANASWAPGGNIRINGAGQLTIENGASVTGGKGSDGHNLYLSGSTGKITLNDCDINNTSANSTNIMIEQGTLTINGAEITNTGANACNVSSNASPSDATKPTYVANITMLSGSITGGTNHNVNLPKGDNFTMEGGTISGGTATGNGGNVNIASSSSFTMNGGEVTNGTVTSVSGPAASVAGKLVMGGNFAVSDSSLTITNGAKVTGGSAMTTCNATGSSVDGNGNTVYNYNKVYGYGGNIYVNGSSSKVNISGADTLISGGTAKTTYAFTGGTTDGWAPGGNICLDGGELTLTDATITGGTALDGNNIYVNSNVVVNMTGAEIINTTSNGQDNIFMQGGTFTMNSGTISSTAENCRNIESNSNGTPFFDMKGGEIYGGKITTSGANGGNVSVSSTMTFKLSGDAKVYGGESNNEGGNFYVNGELSVSGGQIYGGKVKGNDAANSANAFVVNGTVRASGGVIDGGINFTNTSNSSGKLILSNKPVINKGKNGGVVFGALSGITKSVLTIEGTLESGSSVYLCNTGVVSGVTVKENAKYIHSKDEAEGTYWIDKAVSAVADDPNHGKLYIGQWHCECGMPNGSHVADVCDGKFYYWTATASTPTTGGHWYLRGGYTASSTTTPAENTGRIVLDLNGYAVDVTAARMYTTRKTTAWDYDVDILLTNTYHGTDANRNGQIILKEIGDQGRVIWLTNENKQAVVYNIDFGYAGNDPTVSAGYFFSLDHNGGPNSNASSTLKLYNCDFSNVAGIGVTATAGLVRSTSSSYALVKNCTFSNCSTQGYGAALTATGSSRMDVVGCTFTNCTSPTNGGAVYGVDSSKILFKDSTITGGSAALGGGIYMNGTSELTLSGDVSISGTKTGTTDASNVYINTNATIAISNLTEGTVIGISGNENDVLSTSVTYDQKGFFTSDDPNLKVIRTVDGLMLVDVDTHAHCVCGGELAEDESHECVDVIYTEMTASNWKCYDDTDKSAKIRGNYYLTGDLSLGSNSLNLRHDAQINVCLNGHTLTSNTRTVSMFCDGTDKDNCGTHKGTSDFVATPVLNIASCSEGGVVASNSTTSENGRVLWARLGDINCYGITVDAAKATGLNADKTGHTGIALQTGTADATLYNCVVMGGIDNSLGNYAQFGAAVSSNGKGTLSLVGSFELQTADNAIGLYVADGSKIDISRLESVTAPISVSASGVFTTGGDETELKMEEIFTSFISGMDVFTSLNTDAGEAFFGKASCLCGSTTEDHLGECDGSRLELAAWRTKTSLPKATGNYILTSGGIRTAAVTPNSGAKIVLNLNEQTVTGNAGDRIYTPLVVTNNTAYQCTSATLDIVNGEMIPGASGTQGGVFWMGNNVKVSLYNVTVDARGRTATDCGTIAHAAAGSVFNMFGNTTLYGGTTSASGGAMYIAGQLNMWDDSKIIGGTTTATATGGNTVGGAVYVCNSAAVVTMNDNAIIQDGQSQNNGGNVYVSSGTLVMNDNAQILDGKAGNISGNIQVSGGCTLEMNGGKISGGTSYYGKTNESEAAVHANVTILDSGALTMTGGEITGYANAFANSAGTSPKITVSGTAKIAGGSNNLNLSIGSGNMFSVVIGEGGLTSGADIQITTNNAQFTSGVTLVTNVAPGDVAYIGASVPYLYDNTEKIILIK